MRISFDQEKCQGHGRCYALAPELFDADEAAGMLQCPHSGFHVHDAVWVDQDDHAFARRLARYCARNPVALERLTYDAAAQQVTYRSDKTEGPAAGSATMSFRFEA